MLVVLTDSGQQAGPFDATPAGTRPARSTFLSTLETAVTFHFAVPTRRMGADLDQFLDAVFPARPARQNEAPAGWTPATSAVEAADRYVISLDLPGVPAEQVQVVAEQGRLLVSGERPTLDVKGTAHLAERRYGKFSRAFRLPEAVDAGRIDAQFAHGVLTITLPKREPAIARTIEIKHV